MIALQTNSQNMSGNSDGQDLTVHSFHEVPFPRVLRALELTTKCRETEVALRFMREATTTCIRMPHTISHRFESEEKSLQASKLS